MNKKIQIDNKKMSIKKFTQAHDLRVEGYLNLEGTQIAALPDGLSVGGSLYLGPHEVTFPIDGKMKIGGEHHSIEEWAGFTNSQIAAMDKQIALRFWKTWKEPLLKYARTRASASAVAAE